LTFLCLRFLYSIKETLFRMYVNTVAESEEGDYDADTLDSQSELRSTFTDKSRKLKSLL
jgi:hypothetical protein